MISEGYQDRFSGVGRLFGSASLERLQNAHLCVIGVGGVGSWTVEALARSGVGRLTLIDLDDVCVTNTNRQLHALTSNVGRPKVSVLAERVAEINPECTVTAVPEFFTPKTAEQLLSGGYDVLIDAIDKLSNKTAILALARQRGMSVVSVGGAGGKLDPTRIRTGDLGEAIGDDLLRLVRRKLRRDYGYPAGEGVEFGIRCVYSAERPVFPWSNGTCSFEPEPGSDLRLDCSSGFGTATFVTGAFGFAAASEALRVLLRA